MRPEIARCDFDGASGARLFRIDLSHSPDKTRNSCRSLTARGRNSTALVSSVDLKRAILDGEENCLTRVCEKSKEFVLRVISRK